MATAGYEMTRYAEELVIQCKTREEAETAVANVADRQATQNDMMCWAIVCPAIVDVEAVANRTGQDQVVQFGDNPGPARFSPRIRFNCGKTACRRKWCLSR